MANVLTKNYKPRCEYYKEYSLGHPDNDKFLNQFAGWSMERIKASAKPYHKKHLGVNDNGAKGKEVSVTLSELKQIIIKSNGKSPDGVNIFIAPVGILRKPGHAEKLGLITKEERSRFPSIDRIDSIDYLLLSCLFLRGILLFYFNFSNFRLEFLSISTYY